MPDTTFEEDLLEDKVRTNAFDPVLFKRLMSFVSPYRFMAVGGFCLTLLSSLFELIQPVMVACAVDVLFRGLTSSGATDVLRFIGAEGVVSAMVDLQRASPHALLVWFAGAYLAAKLMQFLLDWSNGYLLAKLSQNVLYDVRLRVFTHIQTRSLSFFHRTRVGRLITRVTNDVGSLDEFFSQALLAVMKDIVMLVGVASLLLVANWRLALLFMTVLPPMVIISMIFRHYSRLAYRDWRASLSNLNSVMAETAQGVRVTQLFHHEEKNQQRYATIGREWIHHFMRQRKAWAWYRPGYTILQASAMALVLWFGGSWVLGGLETPPATMSITPGMLTMFVLLGEKFFHPVRDLVDKFDIIQGAMTSAERIFTILDVKEDIPQKPNALDVPSLKGEVRFENVHFEYIRGEPVLKGVSFEVKPGQVIALVGHTGAGKSTIINLLSRFYDVNGGAISVDGHDVRDYRLASLRKNIAVVHQDVFLFAGTIEENISLNNPAITPERVREACKTVGADAFIQRFPEGYNHHVEERGKTFSAGERQLLSFARALAHDPRILVLDEATSSIDTRSEQMIQRAMKELFKGRTSIVIAHRLSTIQSADNILVMHKGHVAEAGTHQQLLARRGIYHRLYQLQYMDTGTRAAPADGSLPADNGKPQKPDTSVYAASSVSDRMTRSALDVVEPGIRDTRAES